ncbi:2-amino-4-hydroxy-6-hydroxymethyldihydropteridine diphosphokinase [Streptomyces sp. SCSIO 30461]|uniref:2-amino-4-hydroxy-6- hydroxymethyldihydropteridine diphosphokinase n=1 Tax=Streptomyces sp. SCSIO 30461 TaxID=3118085 RepID=UPI0030CC4EE8
MSHDGIYLGIGSNLSPESNISWALAWLGKHGLVQATSPVYRTRPVGIAGAPDFLNLALRVDYAGGDLARLKSLLESLERRCGRTRPEPCYDGWQSRSLDLDILLDGDRVATYGAKPWHVPHPDVLRFAHVAVPLADIAGELIHPQCGVSLADIAAAMPHDGITDLGSSR